MTAAEQLSIWAAAPNDEVFVWLQYSEDDAVFVRWGTTDEPQAVGRMRAADVLAGFEKRGSASGSLARDVLARFQLKPDVTSTMRAEEIRGIACVIVDGRSPVSPHAPYRLLLSSVQHFI